MMGVLNHLSTLLLLSLLPPALSHVVDKFSDVPQCKTFFLKETTPNLPGILVGGTVQDQNRYKPICQKYKNNYRFATLYDTTNKIPVFSAYTFSGPPTDPRPKYQPWMIEPQLEDVEDVEEMKTQREVLNNNKRANHQAVDADYDATISSMDLDRGHLFPCNAAPDDATMRSTFTLTNAVPQERGFNRGRWCKMEGRVREALVNNCKNNNNKIEAYVVTGAVPSNNNNNKLNQRLNIPDLMWTAFCCYNKDKKWTVGAYWGENKNDNGKILNLETLGELEAKLKQSYNGGDVKVFHDNCPRNVKVQQVNTTGKKRTREGMAIASGKDCDAEDGCDCDCDEK
ncbi:endonuclease domain-containing 1 protein [Oncorhynchus mykiss]|uniref:Endonuclease domain-containing 1 protein n=1 Tax=Oncorhynchus mykiss TaxID=8022 RepID=A0A8K9UL37_ONCMY|nr:endonuclease domain-containing 1 protein [Oncorhynchus mykiss]